CLVLLLASSVAATGQTSSSCVEVSGIVLNTSDEVVRGARVVLSRDDGSKPQTTTSDTTGSFRFSRVKSGSWEIEVKKDGFKPALIQLSVGPRSPAPLRVVLAIADLHEEITVDNQTGQVNTNPAENVDVVRLDREALGNLPVLGNDIVGSRANFLDQSS